MVEWLLGIASTVVLAVLAWLFTPLRNWLEPVRLRFTRDHGVMLRVYRDPPDMEGLDVESLIGTPARYLSGLNFYFEDREPPSSPPSHDEEWWQWARRHGGEDVFVTHLLLLLQATQERALTVGVPRVERMLDRTPPGIVCGPSGQGGNGLLVRRFYINLDKPDPLRAQFFAADNTESARFALNKGETVALLVIAEVSSGKHSWCLKIPIDADGQRFYLTADNRGRPFVTVGGDGLPFFMALYGEPRWAVQPPNN